MKKKKSQKQPNKMAYTNRIFKLDPSGNMTVKHLIDYFTQLFEKDTKKKYDPMEVEYDPMEVEYNESNGDWTHMCIKNVTYNRINNNIYLITRDFGTLNIKEEDVVTYNASNDICFIGHEFIDCLCKIVENQPTLANGLIHICYYDYNKGPVITKNIQMIEHIDLDIVEDEIVDERIIAVRVSVIEEKEYHI